MPSQAIGLIVGHGYVKAMGEVESVFPAAAAPARAVDFDSRLGSGRSVVNLNGSGDWLIGGDVFVYASGQVVSILDRSRYGHPSFVALARAGLHGAGARSGPLRVFTGMPQAWFPDAAARESLGQAIRHAAEPYGAADVTVAPEVAGVFYDYIFPDGRLDPGRKAGAVGVVDIGFRDYGIGLFHGGRYVEGVSGAGGQVEGLKEIRKLIAGAYGLELALHEVDAAVMASAVTVGGRPYPLPVGSAEALARGRAPIFAAAKSLWPNGGAGLAAIVVGGGGAARILGGLQAEFGTAKGRPGPPIDLRPAGQLAGARGFRAMAAAAAAGGV